MYTYIYTYMYIYIHILYTHALLPAPPPQTHSISAQRPPVSFAGLPAHRVEP